ncbi:MAG TPA: hypothetical protein VD913_06575 [bacterium]|nr:hypothetical protein [bacterium]
MKSCLFSKIIGGFLVLSLLGCPALGAYTDEIEAGVDEVWKAAQDVLKPYGIRKMLPEDKRLETKWIEDRVVRETRLLPIGPNKKLKHTNDRRYRIRVQLDEKPSGVEVKVKGRFQIKPTEDLPQLRWRAVVKPELADYDVERQFFFKILKRIEDYRRGAA